MKYKFEESNITMVFLSVSMAIGIILISIKKSYTLDLTGFMFGNILMINSLDVISLGILILANLIFLVINYRELLYLTYNFEISEFFHVPAKRVYLLFLILLALNIVISVKIAGIIMITAQLILPGMISLNLSKRIPVAVFLAVLSSLFASVGGFIFSYKFNLPSGALIVVLLFTIFLISIIYKQKKR
jgi:zinc transport system permease protein